MITLAQSQIETIFAHARASLPDECCGLLGGRENQVRSVYQLINAAQNPRVEYEAAVADLLKAQSMMRTRDENLIGIYHSHPTQIDPVPSETDVRRAFYRDAIYLIVGCGEAQFVLRAFRLYETEHRWERARLAVID